MTDVALTRRRSRRARWLLLGGAILVLVGILLAAQNPTVLFPNLWAYRLTNGRTIVLKVFVAPCSWTRVAGVSGTATAIAVRVETLPSPLPGGGTGSLQSRDVTVSLPEAPGNRSITDAAGQPIPLRSNP